MHLQFNAIDVETLTHVNDKRVFFFRQLNFGTVYACWVRYAAVVVCNNLMDDSSVSAECRINPAGNGNTAISFVCIFTSSYSIRFFFSFMWCKIVGKIVSGWWFSKVNHIVPWENIHAVQSVSDRQSISSFSFYVVSFTCAVHCTALRCIHIPVYQWLPFIHSFFFGFHRWEQTIVEHFNNIFSAICLCTDASHM